MLPLGTVAPHFQLPDTTGKLVALSDFAGQSTLLVMFICNHCPYVQYVAYAIAKLAREYQQKGVAGGIQIEIVRDKSVVAGGQLKLLQHGMTSFNNF